MVSSIDGGSEVTSLVMYRLAICWDFVFCRVYMVFYTKLSVVYAVSWKCLLMCTVYCKGIVDLPDQCPSLGTSATNEALSDPPATI